MREKETQEEKWDLHAETPSHKYEIDIPTNWPYERVKDLCEELNDIQDTTRYTPVRREDRQTEWADETE